MSKNNAKINNRAIIRKPPCVWKLRYTFLNNHQKNIRMKGKKYFKLTDNESGNNYMSNFDSNIALNA